MAKHLFHRSARWAALVLTLIAIFLMPSARGIQAQEGDNESTKALPKPDFSELIQRAEDNGTVMIIVGMDLPRSFQPEGNLRSYDAIQSQRRVIATAQQALLDNLSEHSVEAYALYDAIPFMALKMNKEALKALIDSPLVANIQEDVPVRATLASSTAVIGAPAVWGQGIDGSGQTVVVLDTGIDANHPFFGGRVVDEACYSNAGGAGGNVSLCPNGNPTQFGSGAADATATQCWNGGPSTQLCDHGSHVAGIAAGDGTNTMALPPEPTSSPFRCSPVSTVIRIAAVPVQHPAL